MMTSGRVEGVFPLFLASRSVARADLLYDRGYSFTIMPANGEENAKDYDDPHLHSLERAILKAKAASSNVPRGVIVAADTVAFCKGKVIGKPEDEDDAIRLLRTLSENLHEVVTAVAVVVCPAGILLAGTDSTIVHMKQMSEKDIRCYIASGEAMGKAGAYAVQETGDRFVKKMEGSFSNVVGLPMELLDELLEILENRGIVLAEPHGEPDGEEKKAKRSFS